jgi:hypothetical protein
MSKCQKVSKEKAKETYSEAKDLYSEKKKPEIT